MARAFEVITLIDRPVAAVWAALTDWPRAADYRYTCEPAAAGTTVSLVADVRTAGLWRLLGR